MTPVRRRFVLLFCLLAPALAEAQNVEDTGTRTAVIAKAQDEKAQTAAPYVPSRVEKYFARIEERGIPFLSPPSGIYPALGGIYPGGGLGLGAGYRHAIRDDGAADVHALFSLATYRRVEGTYLSPSLAEGRVRINARTGWLDAPRIGYFGLGSSTGADAHTDFSLREKYADAAVTWRPVRALEFGAGLGREAYEQRPGTGRVPSIETVFTPATTPGLGEDATFTKLSGTAALLWLESPGYSRRGGLLKWTYDSYVHQGVDAPFGISRTEIIQHIPILRENWVLSFRARAEGVVGTDSNAPFYLLPYLGSGSTLRGYGTGRFRDSKSLLFTGEWRWIPSPLAIDVALFMDAGGVGGHWNDIMSSRLTRDYGIGVRFHAPAATALRVELAHGDEGFHLVFTSGAAF